MLPSRLPPHTVSVLPQNGFAFGPNVALVDSIVPAKFDSGLPNHDGGDPGGEGRRNALAAPEEGRPGLGAIPLT